MNNKKIEFSNAKMIEGIIKSVDAISKTLGPKGSCVAIQNSWGNPEITRDGVTVSKSISLISNESTSKASIGEVNN